MSRVRVGRRAPTMHWASRRPTTGRDPLPSPFASDRIRPSAKPRLGVEPFRVAVRPPTRRSGFRTRIFDLGHAKVTRASAQDALDRASGAEIQGRHDRQRHVERPIIHSLFYADEPGPGKRKRHFPRGSRPKAVKIPHKSAACRDFGQPLTGRIAFLKWPGCASWCRPLGCDIGFGSHPNRLIGQGIVGFFRFHFKCGCSVIRCDPARKRGVFVPVRRGKRGVSLLFQAVKLWTPTAQIFGTLPVATSTTPARRPNRANPALREPICAHGQPGCPIGFGARGPVTDDAA